MSTENQLADEIYHPGFHIIDNFLDHHHYHALRTTIHTVHNNGYFRDAKIGHQAGAAHNARIRKDQIYWLDQTTDEQATLAYFGAVNKICTALNRALFLGLVEYEAHFAVYNPGTFYKKHVDQFATTKARRISCVYYLNDTWREADGGELILYDKTEQLLTTVQPLANRFICFNSDLPHEVCTTHQMRYSISGWLKTNVLNTYQYDPLPLTEIAE